LRALSAGGAQKRWAVQRVRDALLAAHLKFKMKTLTQSEVRDEAIKALRTLVRQHTSRVWIRHDAVVATRRALVHSQQLPGITDGQLLICVQALRQVLTDFGFTVSETSISPGPNRNRLRSRLKHAWIFQAQAALRLISDPNALVCHLLGHKRKGQANG